jgi:hypothetical protein
MGGFLRQFFHSSNQRLVRANTCVQARSDSSHRQDIDSGEQVSRADARALSGAVRQHLVGHQTAAIGGLAPPDAVVGLLRMALLNKIQHCQQHQTGRDHGQQCRLQAVEETRLHQGNTLHPSVLLHVCCHG